MLSASVCVYVCGNEQLTANWETVSVSGVVKVSVRDARRWDRGRNEQDGLQAEDETVGVNDCDHYEERKGGIGGISSK